MPCKQPLHSHALQIFPACWSPLQPFWCLQFGSAMLLRAGSAKLTRLATPFAIVLVNVPSTLGTASCLCVRAAQVNSSLRGSPCSSSPSSAPGKVVCLVGSSACPCCFSSSPLGSMEAIPIF